MPHHACCMLSLLLVQPLLLWMLTGTSSSQIHALAGSICPCSNNSRGSRVCRGVFKAVRPRRFHTSLHACCLQSLLLVQPLLLWVCRRLPSPSSTNSLEASVPAATTVEAAMGAVAASRQSAQGASHASPCVLLLSCSCDSRCCADGCQDFLLSARRFSLAASAPAATAVEAVSLQRLFHETIS